MKRIKRILTLLLALATALSLAACGKKADDNKGNGDEAKGSVYYLNFKPEADKAWQDLAKTYTLASHNYMLKSAGDGMAMFQGCTLLQDSVMIDNQVLINYIVDVLGGVVGEDYADPYGQGRITVIEKK